MGGRDLGLGTDWTESEPNEICHDLAQRLVLLVCHLTGDGMKFGRKIDRRPHLCTVAS